MIDKGEMTKSKTLLVLLDWEEAFDHVLHNKLLESLHRIGVPEKVCNLINNLYASPQFSVSMEGSASEWKPKDTEIRQGCPLSPYLFVIRMFVMLDDIHLDDHLNFARQRIIGIDCDQVV